MKIVVTIGDVHGCIEELNELLNTIQYNQNTMRLVFLGDLVHRGPDSLGVVRKVRELDIECIMGNHEEKLLRWRKHEANNKLTGKVNPMKAISEAEKFANESLSDQDITWMKRLPLKLDLGNNWWAAHAGVEPGVSWDKQIPSQVMRVRYVDKNGRGVSLNADKSQPINTTYWAESWKGPQSIVYGHCVHSLSVPREDYHVDDATVTCLGIDTGCCFGGKLTACLLEKNKENSFNHTYVQVSAKQIYSNNHSLE